MQTPQHKAGAHWIPVHQRSEDEAYFKLLGAAGIKIINPDPEQIRRCLGYINPNGVVGLRDHPLSEQKAEMMQNPVETGNRHALEWKKKFEPGGRFAGLLSDKIAVCGINEPFVQTLEEEQKTVLYTQHLLRACTQYGIRVLALNLSVGWPRNLGTDMPPYWDTFYPLEKDINDGNHFLCVHEYYYNDPDEGWFDGGAAGKWGWLTYRINACPLNVPIIIGEWGMEKWVDLQRWNNEGKPPKGWIGNKTPAQYAEQLWRYIDKVNPNVFAVMPFTTDWGSRDWETQDTKDAHTEILKQKRSSVWSNPYPSTGESPIPVPVENYKLCWPFMPRITQYFGDTHSGLDIGIPLETPIYALYNGIVAWVDNDSTGYGNYIRIHHPTLGFDSFYAHLTHAEIVQGQLVITGQRIGVSGSTGNSTKPHLHLEIRLRDGGVYRLGVSAFSKAQVNPLTVKYALAEIHGYTEK
jgi:hypothetical protein